MDISKQTKKRSMKRIIAFMVAFGFLLGSAYGIADRKAASAFHPAPGNFGGFQTDYSSRIELHDAGLKLATEAMEEGAVLLKNEGGVLPLSGSSPKVTVFGKNSVSLVHSGTGSAQGGFGSGGAAGNFKQLYDSLESAGFDLNYTMRDFYLNNALSGTGRPAAFSSTGMLPAGYAIGETRATGDVRYGQEAWTNIERMPQADFDYNPADTTAGYSNYETVRDSYASYNDAAILVISRVGGEGYDLPRTMKMNDAHTANQYPHGTNGMNRFNGQAAIESNTVVPGARSQTDHYLQLDLNETNMIKEAAQYFDNLIIVLNTAAPLELGFLDDPTHYAYSSKIKAAVWIGLPGTSAIMGLGSILNGSVNPSGGLIDMYYRNFKNDPTWLNLAYNNVFDGNRYKLENGTESGIRFVEYQEDIYMGYRYYETRFETEGANGATWYKNNVVYPYGHGLSYTSFDWEVVGRKMDGADFANAANLAVKGDSTFDISVKVTNKGAAAGKDIVQIYATAPYAAGGIEKASKVLVGFEKTNLLKPGASQVVTVKVPAYYFASYDWSDANNNQFKGYELDAGAYKLNVATDSHNTKEVVNFTLSAGVKIENDPYTGYKVENQFNASSDYMTENSELLSRNSNFANYGDLTSGATRREEWTQAFIDTFGHTGAWSTSYAFADKMGDIYRETGAPLITKPYPTTQTATTLTYENTPVKFRDMFGVDYDDPMWDTFMDQLTFAQMSSLIGSGAYYNMEIDNIGKPLMADLDGGVGWTSPMLQPTGYNVGQNSIPYLQMPSTILIAATFNLEFAYRVGKIIGEEGLWGFETDGTPFGGWYAPAGNIHRSPFSGRNFEYYSEDAFTTGKIMSALVRGAQEKGIYSYIKHYFLNDQETNRDSNGLATWATEQAMREVYARAFEICVKETAENNNKLMGVMTAFNRIGYTYAGGSYAANTTLLRNEWGFRGNVITDFNMQNYMHPERCIIAGNDSMIAMSGKNPIVTTAALDNETYGNSYKWAIRTAAKNILYQTANSAAYNSTMIIRASAVNLTTANNNANSTARTFQVGTAVSYNLGTDTAANYRPKVLYGDRSAVTYTYSMAAGYSLPKGLYLRTDGTIFGTPEQPTLNASGASAAVATRVNIHANGYQSGTQQVTLRVNGTPTEPATITFNGKFLGTAEIDKDFSASVTASKAGTTDIALLYSLKNSTMPKGLYFYSDGTIKGKAQGPDFYTAIITVEVAAVSTAAATNGEVLETAEATFTIQIGKMQDWVSDAVSGKLTEEQVNMLIDAKVNGFLDETAVNLLISAATSGKLDTAQVQALINTAIANKLTGEQVQALIDTAIANRLTGEQIQKLIDDALAGHKEENKHGGCGSSSAAIVALFSLLACAFAVVIKKQV